jgi:hypothetical protein
MAYLMERGYKRDKSVGNYLEKKGLSVKNTCGIPITANRSYVMGTECSPDERDTGLKTPCEVLVGLPARDLHCNCKHARTFCFVFSVFFGKGTRAFSFSRLKNRAKKCESGLKVRPLEWSSPTKISPWGRLSPPAPVRWRVRYGSQLP